MSLEEIISRMSDRNLTIVAQRLNISYMKLWRTLTKRSASDPDTIAALAAYLQANK